MAACEIQRRKTGRASSEIGTGGLPLNLALLGVNRMRRYNSSNVVTPIISTPIASQNNVTASLGVNYTFTQNLTGSILYNFTYQSNGTAVTGRNAGVVINWLTFQL